MRATLVGLLIGIGVAFVGMIRMEPDRVYAQSSAHESAGDSDVVALLGAVAEGQQTVLLIDPKERSLGSYQVNVKTGQVTLRSVRNFRWDLLLDEFNGKDPSPEQIKALLRSR